MKSSSKAIFQLLIELFFTSTILKNSGWFLSNQVISPAAFKNLEQFNHQLIKKVHPHALKIVNSFGIPEHLVTAPAAKDYQHFNSGPNNGETYRPKL
jgi:acyl-CoA oxidase